MPYLIIPQIVYDPGTGAVTFIPTFPPINKEPEGELAAVRHDSFASIGYLQSVTERIDTFLTLDFATVPLSDMASWVAFLGFALAGGVFQYQPDSTLPDYTEYTLESTGWKTTRIAPGYYSFTLKFRQLYPLTTGP